MLLPKFDFHEPKTLDEACEVMAEYGDRAKVIAGGTDLMVNMREALVKPEHVVSLAKIEELKKLDCAKTETGIGALFKVADLAESEDIKAGFGALRSGARSLGTPLVRNLATIGGNLVSARPAADIPPSLIVYGATVVLKSSKGERKVSLDDFFKGPGFTEVGATEILTEIRIPNLIKWSGAGYINLGVRKAADCNLVNVASHIALDGKDGSVKAAKIVMGCVGPTPLRALSAEKKLLGEKPDEKLFKMAGEEAMKDATPIDDFRGSAAYKSAMVGVLTRRTLAIALNDAKFRE